MIFEFQVPGHRGASARYLCPRKEKKEDDENIMVNDVCFLHLLFFFFIKCVCVLGGGGIQYISFKERASDIEECAQSVYANKKKSLKILSPLEKKTT